MQTNKVSCCWGDLELRSREFQTDDSDGDQRGKKGSGDCEGFSEQKNAGNESAYAADACPNGVGRSKRNRPHSHGQEVDTGDHTDNGDCAVEPIAEAIGIFQSNSPNNFKNPCNKKINPRHLNPLKQKGTFVSIPSMACGILKKVPIRR